MWLVCTCVPDAEPEIKVCVYKYHTKTLLGISISWAGSQEILYTVICIRKSCIYNFMQRRCAFTVFKPWKEVHWLVGIMLLRAFPSLPAVVLPFSLLWHVSVSQEFLSVMEIIITNFSVNRMARWLEENVVNLVVGQTIILVG